MKQDALKYILILIPVQALTSWSNEMTLVSAFTTGTANQRIVSPLLCGSHPYLHGNLTYRFTYSVYILHLSAVK